MLHWLYWLYWLFLLVNHRGTEARRRRDGGLGAGNPALRRWGVFVAGAGDRALHPLAPARGRHRAKGAGTRRESAGRRRTLRSQGFGEIVAGLVEIRFEAEGILILADRLVDLAFLVESHAEVVVGIGVAGFQADGFL